MILAIQPSVQNADWAHQWWLDRHQEKRLEVSARCESTQLVFLGDSITHAWEDIGLPIWQQHYGDYQALNLGYAGDRTENVLWRIQNGELDGLSPKLVVLLIGTNNIGHRQDPPEYTALGIQAILSNITSKLPDSKILLLAIFPRGKHAQDKLRILVNQTNQLLEEFADNEQVFWLDLGKHFLNEHGEIDKSVMDDYLHPNPSQYSVWAEAMSSSIETLLSP